MCKLLMQQILLCNRIGHVRGLDKGVWFFNAFSPLLVCFDSWPGYKVVIHSFTLAFSRSLDDTFVFLSPSSSPCPVLFVPCGNFSLVFLGVFVPSLLLGSTQFLEPIVFVINSRMF